MIFETILHEFPLVVKDVTVALLPIILVFIVFQITLLHLPKSRLISMAGGMAYAYIGLVCFFMGLEIGFGEVGTFLGESIGARANNWILIPIGLLIGFSVVLAEPAVKTLVHQVSTVSGGMIHSTAIYASLCIGVSLSVGLAMMRAIWGINIWFFLVPGYLIALVLAKYTPPLFTAVAFDAGGVATGPMTATFVLSFAVGVTTAAHPNGSVADSFGVVAMVAMTPLITLQILGLLYVRKARQAEGILEISSEDNLSQMLDEDVDENIFDETSEIENTAEISLSNNEIEEEKRDTTDMNSSIEQPETDPENVTAPDNMSETAVQDKKGESADA